jgi:hypothetical protein
MTDAGRGLALLVLCALAACGESSDDGDGEEGERFDEIEARSDGLLNEVQDLSYTDPASLPTTGAATYEGVVGLDFEAIPGETLQGYDMAGDLEMTVNFAGAGDRITGTADGFVGIDGEEFDGALIIDDGSLDRDADVESEYTFGADMAGELTGEDGTGWIVDTGLQGDFAGEDHSHAFGDVAGTGCTEAACTEVSGGFVAER